MPDADSGNAVASAASAVADAAEATKQTFGALAAEPPEDVSLRPLLGRDDILGADDMPFEIVKTDEWRKGSAVRVIALNADARARLEDHMMAMRAGGNSVVGLRELFVALCTTDAQGNALFSIEDVKALGRKNARAIDRIFEAAQRLNDVSDKRIEAAAKNFESEGSGG